MAARRQRDMVAIIAHTENEEGVEWQVGKTTIIWMWKE